MRYRLGSIGPAEAASLTAIAMTTNGLFNIDGSTAYANGNLSYLTIPFAALLSLVPFIAVSYAIERRARRGLWELYRGAFGGFIGTLLSLLTCAALMYCAVCPMLKFAGVMHEEIYNGVDYRALLLFMLPCVVVLAWMGFETLGRTAKCFAPVLLISLAVLIVVSIPRQHEYRMYPLRQGGAAWFTGFVSSQQLNFLPPLFGLLVCPDGINDIKTARKSGVLAAMASAIICFAVNLMLSRVFSYQALTGMFMPLCKVSSLSIEKNYIMGLDKLLTMLWVNGGFLTSAYCIYAAALLAARTLGQADVTPNIAVLSAFLCGAAVAGLITAEKATGDVLKVAAKYGAGAILILPAAAAAITVIGGRKGNDKEDDRLDTLGGDTAAWRGMS